MSDPASVDLPSAKRNTELSVSLAEVKSRIKACCSPNSQPVLVAVSKRKPAPDIRVCHALGHLDFGENYVQELEDKARVLPSSIRWHFIGTLQSNKSRNLAAIPNLYCIQTLCSIKAAHALNKALPFDRASPLKVLIQVNTSGEDSKSGLPPLTPSSNPEESELFKLATYVVSSCPMLRLEGLMTIGALERSLASSDTENNADFDRLKETRDLLSTHLHDSSGNIAKRWGDQDSGKLLLSMGMSSDFEAALKSGSDIVRVGTGIFGQRPPNSG